MRSAISLVSSADAERTRAGRLLSASNSTGTIGFASALSTDKAADRYTSKARNQHARTQNVAAKQMRLSAPRSADLGRGSGLSALHEAQVRPRPPAKLAHVARGVPAMCGRIAAASSGAWQVI